MDHIEKFEDLVSSIKADGVSLDFLLCKLFQHSLAGEALSWLKELKPASLTCWEDVKVAFLNNFYDDARSEDLRNKISTFSQGISETFKAAWVRFKGYPRDCPHHGYDKFQLLGIFYRGLDWRYQMALDAASNGNYNTRSPAQATKLIENLASSNSTKVADFERKKLAENMEGLQLAEVKAKLDSVHHLLVNKKNVKFAAEVEAFEPEEDEEEDVNYVNGAGIRSTYTGNQNSSGYTPRPDYQKSSGFTRSYGNSSYQPTPPKSSETEMKSMLEQILEGQQKMTVDFNGKMDALYTDLNGFLPGKTDANPKHPCNAVTLRSGKQLKSVLKPGLTVEDVIELDGIEDADFVDPQETSPTFKRVVKKMVTKDLSREEGVMMVSVLVSAVLPNKIPRKLSDPGSFVLDCNIFNRRFPRSLCDLGSSVNLMPRSVAISLGMTDFTPTKITFVLADRSVRIPDGLLEDVLVRIGECLIPADFVVLEYGEEPKDPLILGRSFSATAGALIDVKNGRIGLHVGDMVMTFDMDKLVKRPTIDGQTFYVDKLSEVAEDMIQEIRLPDPLERALVASADESESLDDEASEYVQLMDASAPMMKLVHLKEVVEPSKKAAELSDWSAEKAPKIELKQLPTGLRYAFLGANSSYPVIVNASLNNAELTLLLSKLRTFHKALGYSLDDLSGISPDLCMHRIHLEEDAKASK
ncbi:uncharacterized protein LOC111828622 [Capsella rubella]|uniref:uncharacterized protein LOC111828622 n=1 Tax=Capsella rubella TaxID=81985 RepID=UPI000CD4DBC7|nr:uncharacterized protein LOC111828622 [Capsella rubella]